MKAYFEFDIVPTCHSNIELKHRSCNSVIKVSVVLTP